MTAYETRRQAAKLFLNAASYIQKYGWQKKGMGVHGQPRCSMGALASANAQSRWGKNLASLMYKALYEELDGMTLTQFNYKFNDGNKVAHLYKQVARSLLS